MKQSKYNRLDERDARDIRREIGELARAYTPEWEYDLSRPDAGTAVAMIFSDFLSENIKKYNQIPHQFQTELVNLAGIAQRPLQPSRCVVSVGLSEDAREALPIKKGFRFLCDSEEEPLVFETISDLCAVPETVSEAISICGAQKKIIPLKGEETGWLPVGIFDFSRKGLEKNGVLLCHENLFDADEGTVYIRLSKTGIPQKELCNPDFLKIYRLTKEGYQRVSQVGFQREALAVRLEGEGEKIRIGEKLCGALYLEAENGERFSGLACHVSLSGEDGEKTPDYLGRGDQELKGEKLYPFGEEIALYRDFYIGDNSMFQKDYADISLEFDIHYEEHLAGAGRPEPEFTPKPIMKRKAGPETFLPCETSVGEITAEYFNGIGWKKFPDAQRWSNLFDGSRQGHVVLSLACPKDWKNTLAGGFEGRMIRLMVVKAENCYLQPCVHRAPVLSNIRLSCSCKGRWTKPDRVNIMTGTRTLDMTDELLSGGEITLFPSFPWEDGVYFGFNRAPSAGPVGIFFRLREEFRPDKVKLRWEYSAGDLFKRLDVIDGTDTLRNTGLLTFMPPPDFRICEIAGKKKYWIRLTVEGGAFHSFGPGKWRGPVVEELYMNAVEAENVETAGEETYYVDEPLPGMEFFLGKGGVLDAKVFVNEKNSRTEEQMKQMAEEEPHRVQIKRNSQGEISGFFVLWDEVKNFRRSSPSDRHYVLDRARSCLSFGDGRRGAIPQERKEISFTVAVRRCAGAAGNVPAGAVNRCAATIASVERVFNPMSASGGSDMERAAQSVSRGMGEMAMRGRIISREDFVREAMAYSGAVVKAACFSGPDNGSGGRTEIILLMKDYREGSRSFEAIREGLRNLLEVKSGAEPGSGSIEVREPVFVKISLDIWVEIERIGDVFEVKEMILKALEQYLDPAGGETGDLKIGELPGESRISMMLYSLPFRGHIKRIAAAASYSDGRGIHEKGLDEWKGEPRAVGIGGDHKIHFRLFGREKEGKR